MDETYEAIQNIVADVKQFLSELVLFISKSLRLSFLHLESSKSIFAKSLYRQRGKLSRRLIHTGMAALTAAGMVIAPVIADEFPGRSIDPWAVKPYSTVLSAASENPNTETVLSDKLRDKIIGYTVTEGDTVSSIAEKFGISEDTIRWQNDLKSKDSIKVSQTLEILPVTGISHKVQKGDTVYSIAKKYDTSAQGIVDFPFNTFTNDETFALAIGQSVIVPDGIRPEQPLWSPTARVRQITPDAGTVVASGRFIWPASGSISQRFAWYHKGVDISNSGAPNVLAADAGTVIVAGWPDGYGYGNRVLIDHGNGYRTLYAHLSLIYVSAGQSVARGSAIGKMGTTGRSTGVHLHFEVIQNGAYLNPLNVLQ